MTSARHQFTEQADVQADAHLEYRARRMVRELRLSFGTGGTRELLDRLQNDFDEREVR